jgi:hypothetical protein
MNESIIEMLKIASDGNPGAATVLVNLFKNFQIEVIERLLEYNIKGPQIWVLYKDLCGEDFTIMEKVVMSCPKELLIEACSKEDRSGRKMITEYL